MEFQRIRLTELEQNKGQVDGLPSNPREWTRTDLDHLITSIKETPELLEARGLIVYPHGGKYIILGGNMRFSALREMNEVDAPCYVMPEDTPIEKLREIIIKDNGAFGSWDYDMLANEWDDLPLSDWGVPAWNTEDVNLDLDLDLNGKMSKEEIENAVGEFGITFMFPVADRDTIEAYIDANGKGLLTSKIVELCQDVDRK